MSTARQLAAVQGADWVNRFFFKSPLGAFTAPYMKCLVVLLFFNLATGPLCAPVNKGNPYA